MQHDQVEIEKFTKLLIEIGPLIMHSFFECPDYVILVQVIKAGYFV